MSILTVSVQLGSTITVSSSSTLTSEVSTSYRPSRTAQLTPSRAWHGTVPVARTMAGCTWCTRSSRRTKATIPTFTKNIQISAGTSNSRDAQNGIDYGDYSGLSFYGGIAHPAWSDNSNSTGNNPDGTLHQLDIYSASVPVRGR